MGCKYVKEFSFGGKVKKAEGGAADMKQDKQTVKKAVHKHEKEKHPNEPLTKLKNGGPSRSEMTKTATLETPNVSKAKVMRKVALRGRKGVPVAPTSPLLAIRAARGA